MHIETNRQRIKRRLEREGWEFVRHGSNHDIYKHPIIKDVIPLPRHRTLSPGLARAIAKKAGWE